MAAAVLLLVVMLVFKLGKPSQVIALFPIVLLLYVPISYYTDQWIYKRRKRNESAGGRPVAMSSPDVRAFTVGAVQENCYIVRADSAATRAVIVDPGDEPERLLGAARDLGVQIEAILLTHTPLRSHRRGRARRARDRSAGLLPADRAPRACRRHDAGRRRASARSRATRPTTRSPAAST